MEEDVKHRKRELKLCDWPSRVLQIATVVRLMAGHGQGPIWGKSLHAHLRGDRRGDCLHADSGKSPCLHSAGFPLSSKPPFYKNA